MQIDHCKLNSRPRGETMSGGDSSVDPQFAICNSQWRCFSIRPRTNWVGLGELIEDSAAQTSLGALVVKVAVFELWTEDGLQPEDGGFGERATMVARRFLPLLPP